MIRPTPTTGNAVAYDDGIFHGTHVASAQPQVEILSPTEPDRFRMPTRTSGDGVAPMRNWLSVMSAIRPAIFFPSLAYTFIHQQAYDSGVRVHNNSYGGAAGPYDSRSAEVDELMWRLWDYLIVFSAGNTGPFAEPLDQG